VNEEVKIQWIESLREGKYREMKQEYFPKNTISDFTLRWKNYYSPLGVLCDMYAKFFNRKDCWKAIFDKDMPEWRSVEFMKSDWAVPHSVYAWAWITNENEIEHKLWNMSFEEAIKFIEAL